MYVLYKYRETTSYAIDRWKPQVNSQANEITEFFTSEVDDKTSLPYANK